MNLKTLKPTLLKLHRWIGIGLAPLFLLIALSGAVLALKPMQVKAPTTDTVSLSTPELIAFLEQLDPLGQEVDAVSIDPTTQQLNIRSHFPDIAGEYDLTKGVRIAGSESESFDIFEFAEHLHKELLIGADIVIQIASYLMLMLVIVAPILAWPKFRHNLTGWHRTIGWTLLPVIMLLPLTGILMSLHVGMPELPRMSQPGTSLSLSQALLSAQQDQDLSGLTLARRFRGGSVLLKTEQGG
ncbi:MAG: PepSY-associated TM helix domain-containing protein, partial [Candidatus Thiodiazotropha sp.]